MKKDKAYLGSTLFGFGNIGLTGNDPDGAVSYFAGINGTYTLKITDEKSFSVFCGKRNAEERLKSKISDVIKSTGEELLTKYAKEYDDFLNAPSKYESAYESDLFAALDGDGFMKIIGAKFESIKINGIYLRSDSGLSPEIITDEEKKPQILTVCVALACAAVIAVSAFIIKDINKEPEQPTFPPSDYNDSVEKLLLMGDGELDVNSGGSFGGNTMPFKMLIYYNMELIEDMENVTVRVSNENYGTVEKLEHGELLFTPKKSGRNTIVISYKDMTIKRFWLCGTPMVSAYDSSLALYYGKQEVVEAFGSSCDFAVYLLYNGELIKDIENLHITVDNPAVGSVYPLESGYILCHPMMEDDTLITFEYKDVTITRKWKCHKQHDWFVLVKEDRFLGVGSVVNPGPETLLLVFDGHPVTDMENVEIQVWDESIGYIEKHNDGHLTFVPTAQMQSGFSLFYKDYEISLNWDTTAP